MKRLKLGLTEKDNLQIVITDDRSTKCGFAPFNTHCDDNSAEKAAFLSLLTTQIQLVDAMKQEIIPRDFTVIFYDGKYDTDSIDNIIKEIQTNIHNYLDPDDSGSITTGITYDPNGYFVTLHFAGIIYGRNVIITINANYNLTLSYKKDEMKTILGYEFRASFTRYINNRKEDNQEALALKRFLNSDYCDYYIDRLVTSICNRRNSSEYTWR